MQRDSAGIRIIESAAPAWQERERWLITPSPLLQIGTQAGAASAELFRVQDVARLSDGRIVVVNGGSDDLRLYSAGGHFMRTIGRAGSGPGEFTDPRHVWVVGADSLVVMDWTRITVFDSAGAFVRSQSFGPWPVRDRFADDTFLRFVIPPGNDPFLPGYSRPQLALVQAAADGTAADTLAYVTGDELFRSVSDAGGVSSFYAPFGLVRSAAVHGDSIYTGDGASFEIHDLDRHGDLVRIIRRHGQRMSVSAASIAVLEAQLLEEVRTDAQRRRRQRLFQEWTYPPFQPAYDQLMLDQAANIWVRHFGVGAGLSQWSVFDPAGRWLGEVEMPAGFAARQIGRDFVLGIAVDDAGVEYVQLYTLQKPGRGS
jgi:hypothetical protein